jgi:hypothetical protein
MDSGKLCILFSQRLFKPVSKFPYVGQAQPSKNDSAVSSAFSSEANRPVGSGGGNYSLRVMRDEQKRANPPMMATFPVCRQKIIEKKIICPF